MKTIKVQYGLDQISRNVSDNATVRELVCDPRNKTMLGYGDNVRVIISGVPVSLDAQPYNGQTVIVETAANQKAAPDRVTVKYGLDAIEKNWEVGLKVRDIVTDPNVKTCLGYGDNVRVMCNGVAVSLDSYTTEGMVLVVETAANQKAS